MCKGHKLFKLVFGSTRLNGLTRQQIAGQIELAARRMPGQRAQQSGDCIGNAAMSDSFRTAGIAPPGQHEAPIELTYNWGVESYEMGSAFGHIALGVPDVYAACEKIKTSGGNVTREPGPVKGGTTVIAFVADPDGYKIELIQRAEYAEGVGLR